MSPFDQNDPGLEMHRAGTTEAFQGESKGGPSMVSCVMCGKRVHPANACPIAESRDGDACEYHCQACRWGL